LIKKLTILFPLVCLIWLSVIFLIPYSPDRVASFFYREILYNRLADLHGAGDSKQEIVVNLFEYVAKNLTTTPDHLLVDRNAFTDIVRGIGWCDQQAFVLMNLLSKAGINESRLRDVQAHTYSEVLIEKNG
jgi:transglutaminase-like putative cysteine protease